MIHQHTVAIVPRTLGAVDALTVMLPFRDLTTGDGMHLSCTGIVPSFNDTRRNRNKGAWII